MIDILTTLLKPFEIFEISINNYYSFKNEKDEVISMRLFCYKKNLEVVDLENKNISKFHEYLFKFSNSLYSENVTKSESCILIPLIITAGYKSYHSDVWKY